MNAESPAPTPAPRKRRWARGILIALLILAALLALLALGIRYALQPAVATHFILQQAGKALGLEIAADGEPELQLRGTPKLVVRGVHARQPGAARELLKAERILLSLPWSTLKSRGAQLGIQRVELDAPVLDLSALADWRRTRPPSAAQRLPTLTRGLQVRRGQLLGEGWKMVAVGIDLPWFAPEKPLAGRVAGRYEAEAMQLPFDLHIALSKPDTTAALGLAGNVTPAAHDWKLPMQLRLSAPMHWGDDGLRLQPAKLGARARYEGGGDPLPFVIGAFGPARISKDGLDWPALALALRGEGAMPQLDGHGALHASHRLALSLAGQIHAWPEAWPVLPAPLSASRSPLPFSLDYAGALDFSDVVAFELQRDATRFDGRLRVRDVLAWPEIAATASPLPPLDGHLVTPHLDIAGAQLEGVEVDFEDPAIPPVDTKK